MNNNYKKKYKKYKNKYLNLKGGAYIVDMFDIYYNHRDDFNNLSKQDLNTFLIELRKYNGNIHDKKNEIMNTINNLLSNFEEETTPTQHNTLLQATPQKNSPHATINPVTTVQTHNINAIQDEDTINKRLLYLKKMFNLTPDMFSRDRYQTIIYDDEKFNNYLDNSSLADDSKEDYKILRSKYLKSLNPPKTEHLVIVPKPAASVSQPAAPVSQSAETVSHTVSQPSPIVQQEKTHITSTVRQVIAHKPQTVSQSAVSQPATTVSHTVAPSAETVSPSAETVSQSAETVSHTVSQPAETVLPPVSTSNTQYIVTSEYERHLQSLSCTLNTYNTQYKIFHYTSLSSDLTSTNKLITYENILFDEYSYNKFIIKLMECKTHNILFVLEYANINKLINIIKNIKDILDKLQNHLQNVTIFNIVNIVTVYNHDLLSNVILERNKKVRKINNIIIQDSKRPSCNLSHLSKSAYNITYRYIQQNVTELTHTFWYNKYFAKIICKNKRLEQYGPFCWLIVILNCIILNQYIINELLTPFSIDNEKIQSIQDWDQFISTVNVSTYTIKEYILIFFNILLYYDIKPRTNQETIIHMIAYKIYFDYVNQFQHIWPSGSIIPYESFNDLWDSINKFFKTKSNMDRIIYKSPIRFLQLVTHNTFNGGFLCSCAFFIHKLLFNDTICIYNANDTKNSSITSNINIIMYICTYPTKKIKSTFFKNFEPTSAVFAVELDEYDDVSHVISAFKCNDKYYLYDSNNVESIWENSWIDTPIQINTPKQIYINRKKYIYKNLISVLYVIYTKKKYTGKNDNSWLSFLRREMF